MAASAYHVISKVVDNYIFRHNHIFRHTCIYKQPISTKKWNYNIFVQILYNYLRYTYWMFFSLLAVISSELQEKKIELEKKVHKIIYVRGIIFLTGHRPSYVIFCHFFCLPSPSTQVRYLLNGPYKNT